MSPLLLQQGEVSGTIWGVRKMHDQGLRCSQNPRAHSLCEGAPAALLEPQPGGASASTSLRPFAGTVRDPTSPSHCLPHLPLLNSSAAAVVVDDNFTPLGLVYLEDVEAELVKQALLAQEDINLGRQL